jgi:hypothetical protein
LGPGRRNFRRAAGDWKRFQFGAGASFYAFEGLAKRVSSGGTMDLALLQRAKTTAPPRRVAARF